MPFGRTELSIGGVGTAFQALPHRHGPVGPGFQGMPKKFDFHDFPKHFSLMVFLCVFNGFPGT